MNTYLLNIDSYRLLDDEINKIILGKDNVLRINYDESDINEIINECNYFSFLNEIKVVIVNSFKLDSASKKISEYLEQPNPNTILILITNSIDKRNNIYKTIKSKGTIIEISQIDNKELITKINNYCKSNDIIIDYSAVNNLIEYNLSNYDLILNEIDKLSIISNKINEDLINKYSSKLNGDDTFSLCDAITSKNYKNIPKLLESFICERKEVIPFISLLANQYRIIYATKMINESSDEIAKLLNIHPYRVKLAKDKAHLYGKEELENLLLKLCDLDKEIKSINVDQYVLLKKFILAI